MRIRHKIALVLVCTLVTAVFTLTANPALCLAEGAADPKAERTQPSLVSVLLDRLPVAFPIPPYIDEDTTMVPLRALAEALGVEVSWNAQDSRAICIRESGDAGENTTISIGIGQATAFVDGSPLILPEAAQLVRGHTVVPLRFFSEAMGFSVEWDGQTRTVSVTSPKRETEIWGFYALGSASYSSWQGMFGGEYPRESQDPPAAKMAGTFLGWFGVNSDGSVKDSGHPSGFSKPDGWEAVMMHGRFWKMPCLAMFYSGNDSGSLSTMLADPLRRDLLRRSISSAGASYEGVAIDFEGLGLDKEARESDAANLNSFLDELKKELGERLLVTVVPPRNSVYGGYDHKHIGQISDLVVVMAYGYEDPATPSPTAPWSKVDEAIRMELELVPGNKVLLGLPGYGTLYGTANGIPTLISRPAAKDTSGFAGVPVFWPEAACSHLMWSDETGEYQAFLETNESLQARINHALRYDLRGVAIWRLGLLEANWWDAVQEAVEPTR